MENQSNNKLRSEIRQKTVGYIIAALSFVAGLAWNDTVKAILDSLLPFSKDGISSKLIHAIVVTVLVVIAGLIIAKLFGKKE